MQIKKDKKKLLTSRKFKRDKFKQTNSAASQDEDDDNEDDDVTSSNFLQKNTNDNNVTDYDVRNKKYIYFFIINYQNYFILHQNLLFF